MNGSKQNVERDHTAGKIHGKNKDPVINFFPDHMIKRKGKRHNTGTKQAKDCTDQCTGNGNKDGVCPVFITQEFCKVIQGNAAGPKVYSTQSRIHSIIEGYNGNVVKWVNRYDGNKYHYYPYNRVNSDIFDRIPVFHN
jgi:hypothetical protein